MREFKSEKRLNKIKAVAMARQYSLHLVLENVHDPHNVSAVLRTCDAAGIPEVSLLYYLEKFPRIGKKSSASAVKWIQKEKYTDVKECYGSLRSKGFKIYATSLTSGALNLYNVDLSEKCAIVLGNEHRGVSDEAAELSDDKLYIPMFGMVQSLNISVAAAIIIYEAVRQRLEKGLYNESSLNKKELDKVIDEWCSK
ncbi:MAG: TrmH family RNA methyltransferase [Ignavibacteriaceae bacterium]|nr:TrmH family RNA methyltransferase [Ignavibacteriaceae bacterium]